MSLVGFLGRPPIYVAKLSAAVNTSDLTTYTFAGLSLGAAHPDRKLFAAIVVRAAGTPSISSVTIGGTSMSSMTLATNTGGGNRSYAGIYAAAKAADATGDLVITMSGAGSVYAAYTLYRALAPTLTAITPKTSTSNAPSETIDIPARGFGLGVAYGASASAIDWSGLTEDTDQDLESSRHGTALLSRHDALAGLTVSATLTNVAGAISAFATAAFGY
jgi:hypothetical protein